MNDTVKNIDLNISLQPIEYAAEQIVFLRRGKSKSKCPEFVMIDGHIFYRVGDVAPIGKEKSEKAERISLSAHDREEMGECIDDNLLRLQKENSEMKKIELYQYIAKNSSEWLGHELNARQVEGKHYTYMKNLARHKRKNSGF